MVALIIHSLLYCVTFSLKKAHYGLKWKVLMNFQLEYLICRGSMTAWSSKPLWQGYKLNNWKWAKTRFLGRVKLNLILSAHFLS